MRITLTCAGARACTLLHKKRDTHHIQIKPHAPPACCPFVGCPGACALAWPCMLPRSHLLACTSLDTCRRMHEAYVAYIQHTHHRYQIPILYHAYMTCMCCIIYDMHTAYVLQKNIPVPFCFPWATLLV
jgi:hypothetical protein